MKSLEVFRMDDLSTTSSHMVLGQWTNVFGYWASGSTHKILITASRFHFRSVGICSHFTWHDVTLDFFYSKVKTSRQPLAAFLFSFTLPDFHTGGFPSRHSSPIRHMHKSCHFSFYKLGDIPRIVAKKI